MSDGRRTKAGFIPLETIAGLIDLPEGWRLIRAAAAWDPPGLQVLIEAEEFEEVPPNVESPRILLSSDLATVQVPFGGERRLQVYRRIVVEPQRKATK